MLHLREVLQLLQVSEQQVWKSGRTLKQWEPGESYRNKSPFVLICGVLEAVVGMSTFAGPVLEEGLCESPEPLVNLDSTLPSQKTALIKVSLECICSLIRARWALIG